MLKKIKKSVEGKQTIRSKSPTRPYSFDLSEMRSKKILLPIAVNLNFQLANVTFNHSNYLDYR